MNGRGLGALVDVEIAEQELLETYRSPSPLPFPTEKGTSKNWLQREKCRRGIAGEDLMDALSLTRERVGVWVSDRLQIHQRIGAEGGF